MALNLSRILVSHWYHIAMAMTLRLTDEQDALLTDLAEAAGISKQEAVVRAITEQSARLSKDAQVRELAREAMARYGPLLDRLAQ